MPLGRTLADYLNEYLQVYASLDVGDDHQCVPPYRAGCPQPININAALATIRHLESANTYPEAHRAVGIGPAGSGNPTGAYQFLHSTWNHYGSNDQAYQAPPSIQDARARQDVDAIINDSDPKALSAPACSQSYAVSLKCVEHPR